MKDQVTSMLKDIKAYKAGNARELEAFRIKYIGRKSMINSLFGKMKEVAPEERKEMGRVLNELKNTAQEKFRALVAEVEQGSRKDDRKEVPDLTLPPVPDTLGSLHPLTITKARIFKIFERIGFNISDGPEIEDDYHNFTALNFPENHPAREMQDTFFIEKDPDIVLRTHTSSIQIRVMENQQPPIRTLAPGRVYRNEAISVRAHCYFHQVEGFYVDKNVGFADLKQTMFFFAREFFGSNTKIRLRPSFFPFTEPSAELDISCFICNQKGCKVCKHTGWVEIGGCGMIDPAVFAHCNIDPETYTGFAFGMGIERIAMLKYQINDIRLFSENDVRFLRQFRTAH